MKFSNKLMHILLLILTLSLFSCSGIQSRYHDVSLGETLAAIAQKYEVPLSDLKEKNASMLASGLHAGMKLYIPFEANPSWNAEFATPHRTVAQASKEAPSEAPLAYDLSTAHFTWPLKGRMSSAFGKRHRQFHEGIDIAAPKGTPIKSARSGHVIYAGNQISGYGNMVIVRHSDSFSTVYAHLSKFRVKKGQFVARGQLVGLVGRTGHATGPHLHFEIRNKRVAVNPLFYLQPQYAANSVGR